jgi:hypothetical protein
VTNGAAKLWETRDLGSAAYALREGLKIHVVDRDRRGILYVFDDPDGRGEKLKYAFSNSPERRFDDCVKELKRLGVPPRAEPDDRDAALDGDRSRRRL